jgi:hypothetical protein
LKQNIAQSEEKGRQLDAEIKRSNKMLLISKSQNGQTLGTTKKVLNYKKREQQLSYANKHYPQHHKKVVQKWTL